MKCNNHGHVPASQAALTKRAGMTLLALLPLSMGIQMASAQERTLQLEEIVVSASRREGSLQDVAASISALGGNSLANRGITNFEDIKQMAAGLYLEMPTNSSSASIRIRGVGTAGNSGLDSSVGVVVDGVYQNFPGMAFTELMDIDRIEVLRGPQGTLFGRNTTAGVINIQTRNPETDAFSGHIQGVAGNLDNRELRGTLNIPLIVDKLAMRVSANTVERDGYSRNGFLGKDTFNQDREGARLKLLWHATDHLDVLWSSDYQNTKSRVDQNMTVYGHDNITQGLPFSGQPWSVIAGLLGKPLPPLEKRRAQEDVLGGAEDTLERHALTIDWSLPGHALKSVSAYEEVEMSSVQDRDQTVLDMSYLTVASAARVITQEVVLSSERDGPLSYLVGAFYQQEDLSTDVVMIDGADAVALRGGMVLPPTLVTSPRENSSVAGFASVTYEFTDQLRLTGGVRYTEDTKDMAQIMQLPMPGSPTVMPTDNEKTFREWTYSAKLQYDVAPDKMVYLAYDRGYKAGGFNAQNVGCILSDGLASCLTPSQLVFDPETTDSIEVGLKSEWLDGRLRLNGAVFYQTYDDFQVSQAMLDQGFVLISNAANVDSMGVELDLNAMLTDRLTLDASLAWVNSEYDEFENAPCTNPTHTGCVNGAQDLSGKRLDNAPKTTANIGLAYRAPLSNALGLDWFARTDVSYRSDAYLHVAQDDRTRQGGYAIYNAMFGVETADGQWKVTLWGKNLGDKQYSQLGDSSLGGVRMIPGVTRTYGVTADWRF